MVEEPFADSSEGSQEVPQSSPDAFHRIVVDFPNAVAIVIPGPFPLARLVADLRVSSTGGGQSGVGFPLLGVDGGINECRSFDERLERFLVRSLD